MLIMGVLGYVSVARLVKPVQLHNRNELQSVPFNINFERPKDLIFLERTAYVELNDVSRTAEADSFDFCGVLSKSRSSSLFTFGKLSPAIPMAPIIPARNVRISKGSSS